MARLLISLVVLLLAAQGAWAQAFGRFGYGEPADLPGVKVSREGFVTKSSTALHFRFLSASKTWRPVQLGETSEVVQLSGGDGCPAKLSADLFSPGFRLYYPNGFALAVDAHESPYLSWSEGSVGDGVPTPNVKWCLLSFQDDQPPVLIDFEASDGPSLTIVGKPGAWSLKTEKPYSGWVHFCLPTGTRPFKTNSAATLGALTQRFWKDQSFWLAGPAKLLDRKIESDGLSVTCTWRFDRSGVVIPCPATLAQIGGYPLSLPTATKIIPAVDEDGPLVVTDQNELTMRFPIRRIPNGRFLAEGRPQSSPPSTVAPLDVPSVVELALENLVSYCGEPTRKLGEDTLASYFDQTSYFAEPTTGQQLPYDAKGNGIDIAAAQSLLMQALTTNHQASSEANSLLSSVLWRMDWLTWRVWTPDDALSRRSAALASLAGALCPEPERRLQAAMLEAGLAAERGLNIYRRRVKLADSEPPLIEPMEGMRQVLFAVDTKVAGTECAFARAMLSEVRVFGDTPLYLDRDGTSLEIAWDTPQPVSASFTLASAYPLGLQPGKNLAGLDVRDALGFTRVQYKSQAAGTCAALLNAPDYAKALPIGTDVPQYSEPAH